jgi:hypothetical protein
MGGDPNECGTAGYRLSVACSSSCDSGCGSSEGSCVEPHGGLGCSDVECCESVCSIDPICCTLAWDDVCVSIAGTACGFQPPSNDSCPSAIVVGEETVELITIAATSDGPELPASCDEGFGLSMESDVWFVHQAVCDGTLRIETCGKVGFDSRIAVYTGDCDTLELVACNDNSTACSPAGASRVLLDAVCGETYRIRVGGFKGASGVGQLTIACSAEPCPSPCQADLDGDGVVSGSDLAALLAAWGTKGPTGDLDGDGIVGGADLASLLAAWGACG